MAAKRLGPWFPVYASDWRGNTALRSCEPSARALYFDLTCIAHDAKPYGQVRIATHVPENLEIARVLNFQPKEYERLLAQLMAKGLVKQSRNGALVIPLLIALQAKSEKYRKIGKLGGNPTLNTSTSKNADKSESVNQSDNTARNPKGYTSHFKNPSSKKVSPEDMVRDAARNFSMRGRQATRTRDYSQPGNREGYAREKLTARLGPKTVMAAYDLTHPDHQMAVAACAQAAAEMQIYWAPSAFNGAKRDNA